MALNKPKSLYPPAPNTPRMTDLETELQSIDGVGPATAERIMEVIDAHASGGENVREALDYLEAGRPGYAAKFLRRAVGE